MPTTKSGQYYPLPGTGPEYDRIYAEGFARQRAEAKTVEDQIRTDLDETRRLLYMVLLGGLTSERWYNLAGSLVNALAHHSKLATADEVMDRLAQIRTEDSLAPRQRVDGGERTGDRWVQGLVDQITEQLGDGPA